MRLPPTTKSPSRVITTLRQCRRTDLDRDRGTPRSATPPTPGIRVRYRGGSTGLSLGRDMGRRRPGVELPEAPTPERCLEGYHLHRTRLEIVAERKVRRRRLTDDGNVEITGRDLREREAA